jgi:hypothetical protein
MDKVYIVMHTTWSGNTIEEVFAKKEDAENYANNMEKSKVEDDGYIEYYVHTYNVI